MEEIIIKDSQSGISESVESSGFSLAALDDWLIANQKIKIKQKVIFFRLLATMTNAGLAIMKSLTILDKQEKNPLMKHIYQGIISNIKK